MIWKTTCIDEPILPESNFSTPETVSPPLFLRFFTLLTFTAYKKSAEIEHFDFFYCMFMAYFIIIILKKRDIFFSIALTVG